MHTTTRTLALASLAAMLVASPLDREARAQSKVGTTAAQFLGISVGAQAIAMGGAFVASDGDVSSLYWNPGAIVFANKNQVAFMNTNWLVGTKLRWGGLMLNLDGDNAVGVSITQLDYGEEDVTTVAAPEGTGERWTAQDLAIALSYSRRLTDRFAIGGSAKYISQSIYNETASNFTFDVGLLFITEFENLRIGMSMSNFGGDMQLGGRDLLKRVDIDPTNAGSNKTLVADLKTDSWPMPLLFRVGVAMDALQTDMFRFTVAVDGLRPNDNRESVNVGGELGFQEMFFVRGGYNTLFGGESAFSRNVEQQGLTLGAGVRYAVPGVATLQVDYAYAKFGLFGNLSTIALAVGF
jgi:opacity protein-like surface antigen